jgi:hypothetical protein
VEVVLPGAVKKKYVKVTKQRSALEANTAKTPYLFEVREEEKQEPPVMWGWIVGSAVTAVAVAVAVSELRVRRATAKAVAAPWDARLYQSVVEARLKPIDDKKLKGFHVLEKSTPWLGTADKRLLVRQWHVDFWKLYGPKMSSIKVINILGTPGIGKSVGLNYILHAYLAAAAAKKKGCEKRYVALILPNSDKFYLFDTKSKVACEADIRADKSGMNLLSPYKNDLLVLHDLGKDAPMTSRDIPTVLATWPKYEKYNEFMKGGGLPFYVPLFTDDEMEVMSKYFFPDIDFNRIDAGWKTWRDAAHLFGNVPRQVFLDPDAEMEITKAQLTTYVMGKSVEVLGRVLEQASQGVNDRLVYYVPSSNYKRVDIHFRRGCIVQTVVKEMIAKKLQGWHTIVRFAQYGAVFENVLHEFLATFPSKLNVDKIRLLQENGEPSADDRSKANANLHEMFPESAWNPVLFCDGTRVVLKTLHYYYPRKANFAVIDSFVYCREGSAKLANLLCFRMTIAEEHRTTPAKLESFVENFNKCFSHSDKPAEISVDDEGTPTLKLGSATVKLIIHLVYVTQDGKQFVHQPLTDTDEEKNAERIRFKRLWKNVIQYCSGPPSVD